MSFKNQHFQTQAVYVEPLHLASVGTHLSCELSLADFSRLKDQLSDKEGVVKIALKFAKDQAYISYVKGVISTCLPLICQRCLERIDYPLEFSISLSPVLTPEAIKTLPSCYEPLLLKEDKISLVALIEEELLLNLPFAPKHTEGECAAFFQKIRKEKNQS